MNISAKTEVCMIIGDPVEHSLSPKMHNAGYNALNLTGQYIFIAYRVTSADLENCIKEVRTMKIHGVSCTIPHKIEVMKYVDTIDSVAQKIGAVNTIVNEEGKLTGYNTDWLGVLNPLQKITTLTNKTVALLGAGGAARAAAYAVTNKGAKLTIYNRTLDHAQELANDFGGQALSREKLEQIQDADIIINTTSLGLHPNENETPLLKNFILPNHIVFDLVYTKQGETRLIREAREQDAQTITGIEMLLYQGFEQFKLFTNHDAPEAAMRKAIL